MTSTPEYLRKSGGCHWLPEQVADTHPESSEKWREYAARMKATAGNFTFHDASRPAQVLRRFRELAQQRNMKFVLVYPPQPRALTDNLYLPGSLERYQAWITEFCQREKMEYVDGNRPDYEDAADFHDPYHLNARGAARFSGQIAETMTRLRE